jgi:hypothetical protein
MLTTKLKGATVLVAAILIAGAASAEGTYGPFDVTVKGYEGDKTNSVSYSGQVARQVLHDSLKKLAGKGNGGANAAELEAQMLSYFNGSEEDLPILAPVSKDGFPIKQTTVNEISSGKDIAGKSYGGVVAGWPGAKTGKDVLLEMISKAAVADGGFDLENGYEWPQLISKFTMGAMSYNQAVDNYLDEKLDADNKPNDAPYSDGAAYTGKEHVWDEAFGYFGAAAHSLNLTADQNYGINKLSDFAAADANGDGVVDLKTEMVFGPAYYAVGTDRAGTKSTNYFNTITQAYVDGRELITSAAGEALTGAQRAELKAYADVIETEWEKVLAEATFKYAGSVYNDIAAMLEVEGDKTEAYTKYVHHWGELKGFALALQTGRNNLGATAAELNELVLMGPVTLDNSYVTGVDADGNYTRERRMTWNDYQLNMLKAQSLLKSAFGIAALQNDQTASLDALAAQIEAAGSAETD